MGGDICISVRSKTYVFHVFVVLHYNDYIDESCVKYINGEEQGVDSFSCMIPM